MPSGAKKTVKLEIDHRAEPILPPVMVNQHEEFHDDKSELMPFLREKERQETSVVVRSVVEQYAFLGAMSTLERRVASDLTQSNTAAFAELRNKHVRDWGDTRPGPLEPKLITRG